MFCCQFLRFLQIMVSSRLEQPTRPIATVPPRVPFQWPIASTSASSSDSRINPIDQPPLQRLRMIDPPQQLYPPAASDSPPDGVSILSPNTGPQLYESTEATFDATQPFTSSPGFEPTHTFDSTQAWMEPNNPPARIYDPSHPAPLVDVPETAVEMPVEDPVDPVEESVDPVDAMRPMDI